MDNIKKRRCHNCKFSGQPFKIGKLTHNHCEDPKVYNEEAFNKESWSAWETLRVFNNTCNNHEFK